MEKIIEIKHEGKECSRKCFFFYTDSVDMAYCSIEGGIQPKEGHPYERLLYTGDCPGPGKYRMTLEKVEEIKCSKCGHINHGIPLDDLDIDDIDYLKKLVVKCWKCFQYVRFPEEKADENQGFEPRGIAMIHDEKDPNETGHLKLEMSVKKNENDEI